MDDNYILPCDVLLPPNTIIRMGCRASTLVAALNARKKWPPEDRRLKTIPNKRKLEGRHMEPADIQAAITEAENLIQDILTGLQEVTGGEVEQIQVDPLLGGVRVEIFLNG